MAALTLRIAGRSYDLACRDGEEDHLRKLANMVDAKASEVAQGLGGLNEGRILLMAALLLADEIVELRSAAASPAVAAVAPEADAAVLTALERLAERIEAIADRPEA